MTQGCSDPKGNDPNVPDLAGATSLDAAPAASCPKAQPSSCPSGAAPSYTRDIAPIMKRSCLDCHVQGGTSADRPLDTQAHLKKLSSTMFLQINSCLMPPADAGADAALSFDDRKEILQWLVCGSPDN
jgi:hypothetical protein